MTTSETETVLLAPEEAKDTEAGTRVVLVDSRADRRGVMRQVFEHSGVDAAVVGEADGEADAVGLVEERRAGLAVVELSQPVADGLATVAALRLRFPELAIVVISFNPTPAVKDQAVAEGADAYLLKPVTGREIMAAMPVAVGLTTTP